MYIYDWAVLFVLESCIIIRNHNRYEDSGIVNETEDHLQKKIAGDIMYSGMVTYYF